MYKNTILQYVKNKLESEHHEEKHPGPVITISREYGCPGFTLGSRLAQTLSGRRLENGETGEWTAVNKEIMIQAAQEVNLPPELVDKITHRKPRGIFAELFVSFSDHYTPSDLEVKKTVANIVRALAHQGRTIIVGRGGAILTRDVEESLHIKLYGSLKWRLEQVTSREKISQEEARRKIERIDQERTYLRNFYAGESTTFNIFDAAFNCEYLSVEQIGEAVIRLLEEKKIIRV